MLKRKYCMFKGSSIEHDFCEEDDDSGGSPIDDWIAWWLARLHKGESREKIFDCNNQKCRMSKTLK